LTLTERLTPFSPATSRLSVSTFGPLLVSV
jgi:hypothetical protein